MDAYVGTILFWAADFAPRGWALCNGASLNISDNPVLYSLIGVTYGGDGKTTFNLPDLRGRVPVGGGISYQIGKKGGTETNTLSVANLPSHSHSATVNMASYSANGSFTIPATSTVGNIAQPDNNSYFAKGSNNTINIYNNNVSATKDVQLPVGTLDCTLDVGPNIIIGNTGNGVVIDNMQPFVVLNYIIAVEGLYPVRP